MTMYCVVFKSKLNRRLITFLTEAENEKDARQIAYADTDGAYGDAIDCYVYSTKQAEAGRDVKSDETVEYRVQFAGEGSAHLVCAKSKENAVALALRYWPGRGYPVACVPYFDDMETKAGEIEVGNVPVTEVISDRELRDAWVQFAAAEMRNYDPHADLAAYYADEMLLRFRQRFCGVSK